MPDLPLGLATALPLLAWLAASAVLMPLGFGARRGQGSASGRVVWAGLIAITRDRLPRLGRFAANGFFAHGYSGHGLALSGLAGRILAEACLGTRERLEIFERLPHLRFPGGVLRTPALVLAMLYYRLRDLL